MIQATSTQVLGTGYKLYFPKRIFGYYVNINRNRSSRGNRMTNRVLNTDTEDMPLQHTQRPE
jgi:hypothetical protein